MAVYSLSKINTIIGGQLLGESNRKVDNIIFDSRKIIHGSKGVFVAVAGERHDGHKFIPDLYSKGVRCFIVSQPEDNLDAYPGAGFILVENTVAALQKFVAYHRSQFTCPVVGITGSNGKTIVKEWLSACLLLFGQVVRNPKSYNSQIGVPLSVWLLSDKADWGVFEAGISFPGEMENLEDVIQPTHGIFTNIGPAHQQNFSSIEEKIKEKLKLFSNCDTLYYCLDHKDIAEAIHKSTEIKAKTYISWSLKNREASFFFKILDSRSGETRLDVEYDNKSNSFTIPFTDKASIENALHVITYLLSNNFSNEQIQVGVQKLQPIAMRLEQLKGVNNCILINDAYNSDINSLSIALDYLKQQGGDATTVILSDIEQSGETTTDLYSKVVELLKQSHIGNFVGIGSRISSVSNLFRDIDSVFFESTEAFIKSNYWRSFIGQSVLIKGARGYKFEQITNILSEKSHTTVLETNLNHLLDNLNYFRGLLKPPTRMMVMVKALAYGSGAFEIASLLQYEKVDYLGVAIADEGIQLRDAGISLPVMVMAPGENDFRRMIEYELEPEIYSLRTLKCFIETASGMQVSDYPVHIKIDTGMHRLGFQSDQLDDLIKELSQSDIVKVKSVFSHLAGSDEAVHDDFTLSQISYFERAYDKICLALDYKPIRHILNSAGIERFPDFHFEMVRLGIGLHGISAVSNQLKPVSSLKTHIVQIKTIPQGETIGYGRRGKAYKDTQTATIPIGYADGLDRKFGNGNGYVMLHGKKCPFIGSICMDMCMIDVTNVCCAEGDEVVIFGEKPDINELASILDTIPYEILTNVAGRVKRVYSKD